MRPVLATLQSLCYLFQMSTLSSLVILHSLWISIQAHSLPAKNLSAALSEFESAPEFQSVQKLIESIHLDYSSRDLTLQPELLVEAERTNESREATTQISRPQLDSVGLTLSQSFSTGTQLRLKPTIESSTSSLLVPADRSTFDWQVSLTQNLWKDGFGRSTRLRRNRENFEKSRDLAAAQLRRAQLYLDFEILYWDLVLANREAELRSNNVRRGREILRWVEDRVRRSAAENTDLLQAKALLNNRELQLASVAQNLNFMSAKMHRYIPGISWQPDTTELAKPRAAEDLIAKWQRESLTEPLTFEVLAARSETLAARIKADESRESIRPEFNLQLSYGKNAIDTEANLAARRAWDESHEYSSIGLTFKTGLDLRQEYRKVESARAVQASAEQKQAALEADARVAWFRLKQEIEDLKKRIAYAEALVETQKRKADAERERYRKGRSTAFQSITFEQDAAESEIALWSLYALMRKTEARARLFAN